MATPRFFGNGMNGNEKKKNLLPLLLNAPRFFGNGMNGNSKRDIKEASEARSPFLRKRNEWKLQWYCRGPPLCYFPPRFFGNGMNGNNAFVTQACFDST